jgi:hypothetical protein
MAILSMHVNSLARRMCFFMARVGFGLGGVSRHHPKPKLELKTHNCWGNSGKSVTLETSGFDKVFEAYFSGTGSSRFSEAWNLRSLGFANV